MIYQPFEPSKNFIGTYFGHMVTISDLEAGNSQTDKSPTQ